MALTICGGKAFNLNAKNENETTNFASEEINMSDVMQQAKEILNTGGSALFRTGAFNESVDDEQTDVYDEYCISYHKLTEHEEPRQVLRQINQSNPGAFTSEQIDGIEENLGKYFDLHYILHGGILIDYRFYDPFGDYINSDMLSSDDKRFSEWQMQVFDTLDHQYQYGLDDAMIEDIKDMIKHHTKGLM